MHVAGRLLGLDDPFAIEASGRLAGLKAAADCGKSVENNLKESIENQASLPGPPVEPSWLPAR
jgi:sarcosine oxidase, subunit alpha